jgi:hypothetical protein
MSANTQLPQEDPSPLSEGQAIRRSIEVTLEHCARREAADVHVAFENGCAFLSGTVRSWAAWRLIHDAAEGTRGVLSVDDRIQIDPDSYTAQPALEPAREDTHGREAEPHWQNDQHEVADPRREAGQ